MASRVASPVSPMSPVTRESFESPMMAMVHSMFDTVSVYIGGSTRPYRLRRHLLCSTSPLFREQIDRLERRGEPKTVHLSETDRDIFEMYVHWKNTGEVFSRDTPREPGFLLNAAMDQLRLTTADPHTTTTTTVSREPVEPTRKWLEEHEVLVISYIFGHEIGDRHFQNAIMDACIFAVNMPDDNGKFWQPVYYNEVIFSLLPPGSPLRRFIADLYKAEGVVLRVEGRIPEECRPDPACVMETESELDTQRETCQVDLDGPYYWMIPRVRARYHHSLAV